MEGGATAVKEEEAHGEADLPPPPPLPKGASVALAPGYAGHIGPSTGPSGSQASDEPPTDVRAAARARGRSALAALGIAAPKLAVRPGFGRKGRPVELSVNHFEARLTKLDDVFHYNVSIDPPVTNKKIARDIMKKLRDTFGEEECGGKRGAYDGEKSLFTSGSLNFNRKQLPVYLDDERGPTFKPGDRSPGHSPPVGGSPGSPGEGALAKRRRTKGRGRDFYVTIEFAAKIRMRAIDDMMRGQADAHADRAQDALRVLDIVLRESASERGYLLIRDNFFHPNLGPVGNLGEGVEAWRGYHSSIRPTGLGLTLNLDITMTTILKPILVEELLKERFNVRDLRHLQGRDWSKARAILKNVRVETTHMAVSRAHKITGFSDKPIRDLTFTKRIKDSAGNVQEEEVSVEQYYFDVYKHRLQYPDLPALDVGNRKKPTYIPVELCKVIAGQRFTKSLSTKQRQLQIAECKQSPQERRRICENAMAISKYNSDPLIAEFGLQFRNQLAAVKGRILSPPQLEFGGGRTEEPREGRWNFNNKSMQTGATVDPWAVAVFDDRCFDGQRIGQQLAECCLKRGMRMRDPICVQKEPPHASRDMLADERVAVMMGALRAHKPVFILAILPSKDSDIYVPFKKFCEVKVGVTSQCMVKPRNLNDQYFGNLALKINLKMGGLNSPLSRQMTEHLGPSTIIFGMDVSHGAPGDADSPSIAAVVATKNWPTMFHYASHARTQAPKLEMIEGLYEEGEGGKPGGMVKDLILEYYQTYKGPRELAKPSQIIVYRDGVSESQFDQCLEQELIAFKRACNAIEEGYNPGITFIVAQKRHNTRFFPSNPQSRDILPKNGNVLPGTIVDKDVCHPHNYDFFLISHAGLIVYFYKHSFPVVYLWYYIRKEILLIAEPGGTARPTHYHVLYNENKLGPDDIQQLTNHLCYTFGRCTTSIAMAAPAAYAHLVATRYRKLVDTWGGSDTNSQRSSREGGGGGAPRPVPALPSLKLLRHQSMFFC